MYNNAYMQFPSAPARPGEKLIQKRPAFRLQHAAVRGAEVGKSGVLRDAVQAARTALLGIVRAKYEPTHPGLYDGPGAHRAGLKRNIERAIVQPPAIYRP